MSSLSNTILTYSAYILGCLWLYSAVDKDTNDIDVGAYIIAANIGRTFARNTFIGSTYVMNTLIGYINIEGTYIRVISARDASVRVVKPKILVELGRILAILGLNDCCFLISIRLIFAWTKEPNYWYKKKWNLENSHVLTLNTLFFTSGGCFYLKLKVVY